MAKAVDKAVEKVASTAYEAPALAEMRAAVTAVEGSEVAAKATRRPASYQRHNEN